MAEGLIPVARPVLGRAEMRRLALRTIRVQNRSRPDAAKPLRPGAAESRLAVWALCRLVLLATEIDNHAIRHKGTAENAWGFLSSRDGHYGHRRP